MPRAKAYSGKKKKEQLQQRRSRKQGRDEEGRSRILPSSSAPEVVELGADKGGVHSMFAAEKLEQLEKRRQQSFRPIEDRHFEPGIPYGEWFRCRSESSSTTQIPVSLSLPRRPFDLKDYANFTPEEIAEAEARSFTHWLEQIGTLYGGGAEQSSDELSLFERNPKVWQQLWHVVERSDVVIVVADARYPIFHLPVSLLHFIVKTQRKQAVIVLNKVDLVPRSVLDRWKVFLQSYFSEFGELPVLEFSCLPQQHTVTSETTDVHHRRKVMERRGKQRYAIAEIAALPARGSKVKDTIDGDDSRDSEGGEPSSDHSDAPVENFKGMNKLRAAEEREVHEECSVVAGYIKDVFAVCKRLAGACEQRASPSGPVTIGIVGHPNVGKSRLLNCLIGGKAVSVSATAGHTKHLQTIPVEREGVVLVDCPGICFPVLGVPRPLQAVMGTHQLAQTRDPQSGIGYLARRLPIEQIYGLSKPFDEDGPYWSAYELCEAYALKRGFHIRGKNRPDVHRAAIQLLSEAYDGHLVIYFCPPPQAADAPPLVASHYFAEISALQ